MLHDLVMVPSNCFSPVNIKKYSRDYWPKIEKDLGVCKMQIQKKMQNKKRVNAFTSPHFFVKTL